MKYKKNISTGLIIALRHSSRRAFDISDTMFHHASLYGGKAFHLAPTKNTDILKKMGIMTVYFSSAFFGRAHRYLAQRGIEKESQQIKK